MIPCTVHSTGAQMNLGLCSLIWIMGFVALHNPLPYKCPPPFTCLLVKAEAQFVTADGISPDTITRKFPKSIFELPSLNILQLSVPKNVVPFHLLSKFTGTSATTTPPTPTKLWCRLITVSNCKDYFEFILLLSSGSNYHHIQQRST
jgi:hypothetical protein